MILNRWIILSGKVIGAIAILISSAYGAYKWAYSQGVNAEKENNKSLTIEYKVDKLLVSDSLKTIWLDTISNNQTRFYEITSRKLDRVTRAQDNLKSYMIEKAPTKDELQKVYDIFNTEKKNENIQIRY